MADVKWIKIVTDIFDDEKILLIESMPEKDSLIVIWFKLLCLAGKQNNSGVLLINERIPYTDEMLSTIFRRPINTIRLALSVFEQYGMIEIVNGAITIPNWGRHQSLDQLENKKAYMREYMADYRAKQRALSEGKSNCKTNSKTNVSSADKIREEREEEIDNNIIIEDVSQAKTPPKRTTKKFVPPSLEDVIVYCNERGNNVDAQRFIDYYSANGWKVGRNAMKDWKAAVRTWEKNGYSNGSTSDTSGNPFYDMYLEAKAREGYDGI